ncbi:hypothetical protein KR200_001545, partial [Drosophila serrata]
MNRQAVRDWLALLTMEKYTENFLERGYDCIARLKLIVCSDLVMLGVDNPGHRKLLLNGVQFLINSPEFAGSEPCELHGFSERKEEDINEESTTNKYLELFKFLDIP